jgi:hypothetical protein
MQKSTVRRVSLCLGDLINKSWDLKADAVVPFIEPSTLRITWCDKLVGEVNGKPAKYIRNGELRDNRYIDYTTASDPDQKITVDLSSCTLDLDIYEYDQEHKKRYMEKLESLKREGKDLISERKNKIQEEMERIIQIKDYIICERVFDKLNFKKDKHIKTSFICKFLDTKKENANGKVIDKQDIYGMFYARLLDFNEINKIFEENNAKYNIPHVKITIDGNTPENVKNEYIKRTVLMYLLTLILKTIDGYEVYLKNCIKTIDSDAYYSSSKFGMNDTIMNKIIEITDENRYLISLDDHYDKIYIFKDYFTPGIVRAKGDFYLANCIILCRSKPDRGNEWNIFPGAYERIGDREHITLHDIMEIEDRFKYII